MEDKNKFTFIFGLNNIFPMNDPNIFNLGLRGLFRNNKNKTTMNNDTILNKTEGIVTNQNAEIQDNEIIVTDSKINLNNTISQDGEVIIVTDQNVLYKINPDNTLTYPDGHSETIIPADMCGKNPLSCFTMTPGTSRSRSQPEKMRFGKTNNAIEFYKKTIIYNGDKIDEVLTTLIVPSGVDIFFSSPSLSNSCNKRVSKAIVRDQYLIENNKNITESWSIFDRRFKYKTNSVIVPGFVFDNYGEWVYDGYPSSGNGIHVYSTKNKALDHDIE
jgi:hypothetical protein